MRNNNEDDEISSFAQSIDKSKLAKQIQNYLKGGNEGLFHQKKSQEEVTDNYKNQILQQLRDREKNNNK